MTYLEKYHLDNPDRDINSVVQDKCPGDLYEGGAEPFTKRCWTSKGCAHCWDREIPETATGIGYVDAIHLNRYDGQAIEICQSCILCGESIPCGGPLICDGCRDLWKKLKEARA